MRELEKRVQLIILAALFRRIDYAQEQTMAFRVQLDMTEEAYHRVERYARDRKQDIETVIADLVDQNLPTLKLPLPGADPSEREIAAFRAMHEDLKKTYGGEYVAIYQGKLVDHHADLDQLHQRIEARFPDHFVLIRPIGKTPDREFFFRSPRLLERVS